MLSYLYKCVCVYICMDGCVDGRVLMYDFSSIDHSLSLRIRSHATVLNILGEGLRAADGHDLQTGKSRHVTCLVCAPLIILPLPLFPLWTIFMGMHRGTNYHRGG